MSAIRGLAPEYLDSDVQRPEGGHHRHTRLMWLVRELLITLGEDPDREGLLDTPGRVATAYGTLLEGYDRELAQELTVFENAHGYDDIIVSGGIAFYSTCEHHLLP